MKVLHAFRNGSAVDLKEVEHHLDPSFRHREGVYEAIQTYHGRLFRLQQHLERLKASAEARQITLPYPIEKIRDWCEQVVSLSPDTQQFLLLVVKEDEASIITRHLDMDQQHYENGYRVITSKTTRPDPSTKSLEARLISAHAMSAAQQKNCQEAILFNEDQVCTEGAYSNLFWITDGQVYTSKENALAGITQQAIIDAVGDHYDIQFGILHLAELHSQDEVFLSSSRIGVMPVTSIDEKSIGNGKPGPVTKDIMKLFDQLTQRECSA